VVSSLDDAGGLVTDRPTAREDVPRPEPEPTGGAPLAGRTVVVTGASAGIGAAAAREVAAMGARVIVVGRSPEKTTAVADSIGATALLGDFARLADVRRVADEILAICPRIDVLANNAGAMYPTRMTTDDGHEMTFQVNHLAGFLLTGLLLPRLAATPGSRVLTTSSMINRVGHIDLSDLNRSRRRYRQFAAYADSKLANVLFVRELARRVAARPGAARPGAARPRAGGGGRLSVAAEAPGPTATAFHPGMVRSTFGRDTWFIQRFNGRWWNNYVTLSPEQGAAPMVALAVRPDPHTVNGAYLHRFRRQEWLLTGRQARDTALAARLWDRCAELVDLPG
jgi:NAD(P)-dependent dehydrogenase (short-subunit alcohol dehydrogenase family)